MTTGHITLLPAWLLRSHAEQCGWTVVAETYCSVFPRRKMVQRIAALVAQAAGKYVPSCQAQGDELVLVLAKRRHNSSS